MNELALLVAGGAVAAGFQQVKRFRGVPDPPRPASGVAPLMPLWFEQPTCLATVAAGAGASSATAFGLGPLFLFFLKVGAVRYGSGYVLLAFLRADLVERRHWLSEAQLLDAVAVGQITPGPLFTTATFVGYVLGGVPAALIATAGIFLPAFVLVALSGLLLPRLRQS